MNKRQKNLVLKKIFLLKIYKNVYKYLIFKSFFKNFYVKIVLRKFWIFGGKKKKKNCLIQGNYRCSFRQFLFSRHIIFNKIQFGELQNFIVK